MSAKFGPAGTAESFKSMGYKTSLQVPEYLQKTSTASLPNRTEKVVENARAARLSTKDAQ